MEHEVVFNAAGDGDLFRLRVFFHFKSKGEVMRLVSGVTGSGTPLIIACLNGHVDVVRYLIQECYADVNELGYVVLRHTKEIYEASPLWCACASGHLNIIQTLLEHNASVNGVANTDYIPLHIACFDGDFAIAEYLIHHGADIEKEDNSGNTCLMIACLNGYYEIAKYLVDCGADVNRRCIGGKTALHESATSGCLKTFKMLLEHGAGIYADIWGVYPVLYAANSGEEEFVDYFIKECKSTKQDAVDAIELLGVAYVHDGQHMEGLDFWKQAMELRYEDSAFVLEKPKDKSSFLFCVDKTEVSTADEIEELIADHDEMRMQALLISVRILGESHPLVLTSLTHMGESYSRTGNYERCVQLFMFVLETEQRVQPPLSSKTVEAFISFIRLFSTWFPESASIRDVLLVLKKVLKEIERALNEYPNLNTNTNFDTSLVCKYDLTVCLALYFFNLNCAKLGNSQSHLNADEELSLKNVAHRLVTLNPTNMRGETPLHLASFNLPLHDDFPTLRSASAGVVQLLLEVGACPNALNSTNDTPLHYAASNRPFDANVFQLLLNNGAHLDIRNKANETPLQLVPDASVLNIKPLRHTNLQCLCAQAIQVHKISYAGVLHKNLYEFVHLHCSD